MFPGSRKASSNITTTALPQPTLLAPTETTTADTTTPWFLLPYWRKRNVSQPTILRRTSENYPPKLRTSHSSRLLSLNKDLPPTPSNEGRDFKSNLGRPEILEFRSSHHQESKMAQAQKGSPVAIPAARGPCISLASASTRVETVVPNAFLPSGSSPVASKSIRRTKSAHRLRAPNDTISEHIVHRRHRGLSFNTPDLLLNAGDSTSKGKGKELEPPNLSKPLPQPLSRRPSFWSKKRSPTPPTSTLPNDNVTLSPLPLVDVSPFAPEFTIESFQSSNPNTKATVSSPFQKLQSDNVATRCTTPGSTRTSSVTSFEVVDAQLPKQGNSSISRRPATPPLLHRLSFRVFSCPEPARPNFPNQSDSQPATPVPFPSSPSLVPQISRPSMGGELPEDYVSRLKTRVSKAEVASVLASSSDIFFTQALRAYLEQFEFSGIPLDVALRKLLMEVGLPRETQQIDRVMEAFAFRYRQCNPNLFTLDDHPYILAFSLIMLHTDAFNPSNKRKMTKADYIKNTKLPGIPTEVLDCFFDNIVFVPFIFIEDPEDVDTISMPTSTSVPSGSLTTSFRTTNKVDPYYLIMNDLLDPLRVDVNSYIPFENPFTYEGINGSWNEEHLHDTFLRAHFIDTELLRSSSMFSSYPSLSATSPDTLQDTCRLKVIKAGMLNKKDDLLEGGKKALSRKWKKWGVILSDSHLLFCRNPSWASTSSPSPETSQLRGGALNTKFRPDEIYSLENGVAVYDRSYTKYDHTFRFVLPDGRHLLLQAADDEALQQWISCINYASAFKSAGMRMCLADAPDENLRLSGAAASTPHLHLTTKDLNRHRPQSCSAPISPNEFMISQAQHKPVPSGGNTLVGDPLPRASVEIRTDQSGNYLAEYLVSSGLLNYNNLRSPHLVLKKICELDAKITTLQLHLESSERLARNIAILTPFRKATRSKLLNAIQNLAKPLMQIRLEMERLKCYRTVLLVSGNCSRMQTKRTTLRGVADSRLPRRPNTAPTMSRLYDDFESTPTSLSPSNSTSDSFHSARESTFAESAGNLLHTPPSPDVHKPKPSSVSSPLFEPGHEGNLFETPSATQNDFNDRRVQPCRNSSSENVSQGDDDDQVEEDWTKTRVAQRVSLIHFPSDIAIAIRLKAILEGNNDQD